MKRGLVLMEKDPYSKGLRLKSCSHISDKSEFDRKVEIIPVREAFGRVNYREVIANTTLPDKSLSIVDGIAIKSIYFDFLDTEEWCEGYEYTFRKAGAEIPYGFDAVVPTKDYDIDIKGRLKILKKPKPGRNMISAGSLMQKGEVIAPALASLGELELELFNACGIAMIEVLTEMAGIK